MFEVEKPKLEAPLALAAIGGAWGAGALGSAGILGGGLIGGLAGATLGYAGGTLLEGLQPKMQNVQQPSAPANAVPQTPSAVSTPATPGSTPAASTVTPGESSAPTSQEIARGELERKRRGRVSTILTSRAATVGEEENERLGGPTGGV